MLMLCQDLKKWANPSDKTEKRKKEFGKSGQCPILAQQYNFTHRMSRRMVDFAMSEDGSLCSVHT